MIAGRRWGEWLMMRAVGFVVGAVVGWFVPLSAA